MCGIHGFTWRNREEISKMMKISEVRGPDGEGKYIDDNISLGHNLLAITEDAKCSEQPWTIDENRIMCYNGEIYNYNDFGDYKSDGECLIPLYKEYGA